MHYIYILYSKSSDIFYVGETNDIEKRLHSHNNSIRKTYTSKHRPWIIVSLFVLKNRTRARYFEAFIKRMKSKKFIKRLIEEKLYGELEELVRVPKHRD